MDKIDREPQHRPPSAPKPPPTICIEIIGRPIEEVKGIGPKAAAFFRSVGVSTIGDLLKFYPYRYVDNSKLLSLSEAEADHYATFAGRISGVKEVLTRNHKRYLEARFSDRTGTIHLKWFHYKKYLLGLLETGSNFLVRGEPKISNFGMEIHHPEIEAIGPGVSLEQKLTIKPIYPYTSSSYKIVNNRTLTTVMKEFIEEYSRYAVSLTPDAVAAQYHLPSIEESIARVHAPSVDLSFDKLNNHSTRYHKRIIFDELFLIEISLMLKKNARVHSKIRIPTTKSENARKMVAALPFTLSTSQKRSLAEISKDMKSGHAMFRILQGDVGSGKTIVAFLAAVALIEHGYQVALMAPTEILAVQHYENFNRMADGLGIESCLVTGKIPAKQRRELSSRIQDGSAGFIVGTQSLFQKGIAFHGLGLVIIDEQHKFGVSQRYALSNKGDSPHVLIMTATPIPRTLAMTLYGDLDISTLEARHSQYEKITTRIAPDLNAVKGRVDQQLRLGHQIYFVYPLVDESSKSEMADATSMSTQIASLFPDVAVGLIHGRMTSDEKRGIMSAFTGRRINILVSTSIIEVGIDNLNATVIVIEHPERFGLSQLHQIRGRVGRGDDDSYCFLIPGSNLSEEALERLKVIEKFRDGMEIAKKDLEIRGPGEILSERQSGFPGLYMTNLIRDSKIIEAARSSAEGYLASLDLHQREEIGVMTRRLLFGKGDFSSV